MSLSRAATIREPVVKKLHAAWDSATPRERAKWISELRHITLDRLRTTCETLLRDDPASVRQTS